jgi:ABC-type uncharacterized transport system permease subunit
MNEIALLDRRDHRLGHAARARRSDCSSTRRRRLNLGAEGMMLVAAIAGSPPPSLGQPVVAFAAGAGAGMILAAGFGVS